ncbi:CotG/ExsB N-terminal domain-containing protein [Priestia megaterium]|uniref:CotG/ExsB N-terminal domain-containing protein n=1 Tax=Priestia megaterium TaxID=1404 RepID=UPI00211E1F85|nr:hypothetical protein [Priestia megaterium]
MHITAEKIKEAAEALESTELKSFMFQEPTAGPLTRRRRSSRSTGRSRRSTRGYSPFYSSLSPFSSFYSSLSPLYSPFLISLNTHLYSKKSRRTMSVFGVFFHL